MNHSHAPCRGRSTSSFVLVTACAAFASACSGSYPLGETREVGALLEDGDPTGAALGDARVPSGLAAADVTISESDEPYPGTLAAVGDLDGDGRDEMAVASIDDADAIAFVHVRYGGPRPSDAEQAFAFERGGAFLTLPSDDRLTPSVTAAGDVDGDGFDDLLVRTEDCDTTGPREGAYLVYGSPERLQGSVSLASVAAHFAPSERVANPPRAYGLTCGGTAALGAPGDLDGDGFDDLVITREPMNDTSNGAAFFGTGEGVYLFYGRSERFSGEVPLASADATFTISERIGTYPLGDVDGDGRADLIVGPDALSFERSPGSFLLRGRAERWSGPLDLAANATLLEGAYVTTATWLHATGDLDGDGVDDVVLWAEDRHRYLFYGAPGLFVGGIDFSQADATVGDTAGYVFSVGDRDADGDEELIDQFTNPNVMAPVAAYHSSNVAFVSGSRERLSGIIPFPENEVTTRAPNGPFPDQLSPSREWGRALRYAIPAGDLDGDGAADLFTTSAFYETLGSNGYERSAPLIHIHYGAPAARAVLLR